MDSLCKWLWTLILDLRRLLQWQQIFLQNTRWLLIRNPLALRHFFPLVKNKLFSHSIHPGNSFSFPPFLPITSTSLLSQIYFISNFLQKKTDLQETTYKHDKTRSNQTTQKPMYGGWTEGVLMCWQKLRSQA